MKERVRPLLRQQPIKLIVIDSIAALCRFEFSKEQSIERARVLISHAHQLNEISEEYKLPILVVNQVTDYIPEETGHNHFNDEHESEDSQHSTRTLNTLLFLNRGSSRRVVVPSLGLAWTNYITMRILLNKENRFYDSVNVKVNSKDLVVVSQTEPTTEESQQEVTEQNEETTQQPSTKRRKLNNNSINNNNNNIVIPIRKMTIILSSYLPNKSIYFVIENSGMRGINFV
jgi:hypothetical protein